MKIENRVSFWAISAGVLLMVLSGCASNPYPVSVENTAKDYTEMAWDALEAEDYEKAIEYSTVAINNNMKLAESYYVRGAAYRSNHEPELAVKDLSTAIDFRTNELGSVSVKNSPALTKSTLETMSFSYYMRAWAYVDLGDNFKAREDAEEALRLRPGFQDLVELLEILRGMVWAWEWKGVDPIEQDKSYTFIFNQDLENLSGKYEARQGQHGFIGRFDCYFDSNSIDVELDDGTSELYHVSFYDGDEGSFVISNWGNSGNDLVLRRDEEHF
jgi:tetratricopeptide (TPR) repeat protein